MKKEIKPKIKNLISKYTILYYFIFIFLIIFYINNTSFYVYTLFISVFIFLIGLDIIIQLINFRIIIFYDTKLALIVGFNKRKKEIILYNQIHSVSSTTYGNRFLSHEHIILSFKTKNRLNFIKIYQSFFTNEEFRQIHLEFIEDE